MGDAGVPGSALPPPGATAALLQEGLGWLRQGRRVALATVVETWGSSPRPAGSHLLVRDDGAMVGSVSGGCVEGAVVTEARALLDAMDRAGTLLDFGVADEDAWEVGLACGGRVLIHVAPVFGGLLAPLVQALAARTPVVLGVELEGEGRRLVELAGGTEVELRGVPAPERSDAMEDALADAEARETLERDRPVRAGVDGGLFLRPYLAPARLVLVGAGHIAQEAAALARPLGLDVTVVDPRQAFATEERFPDVELLRGWPNDVLPGRVDGRTAVVTLSHDPKIDDPGIRAALEGGAFFVGALGSTRTHRARLERLESAGVDPTDLSRIDGPVGVDIGARTPAEIALAVLAQLVQRLRRGEEG